jgi:hypothetical protein
MPRNRPAGSYVSHRYPISRGSSSQRDRLSCPTSRHGCRRATRSTSSTLLARDFDAAPFRAQRQRRAQQEARSSARSWWSARAIGTSRRATRNASELGRRWVAMARDCSPSTATSLLVAAVSRISRLQTKAASGLLRCERVDALQCAGQTEKATAGREPSVRTSPRKHRLTSDALRSARAGLRLFWTHRPSRKPIRPSAGRAAVVP